jgi:prepilin-type N-terminal cleavage/methylation domain-containing protein
MNQNTYTHHHRAGFTLIEVVVTIVMAAIAVAVLLPFLSDVFLRSHEPRRQLVEAMELHAAMESLVARHTNRLAVFHETVGPEGTLVDGHFLLVENRYTGFLGGQESGTSTNLLKITLENTLGERVTRFFTVPL